MTKMKKAVSYVLVFLMVFSSFTILPSEFWGWADVSAVDVLTEQSSAEETYTEGDFTYSLINDNTEVEIVSYNSTNTDIVIPDVVTGSEFDAIEGKKVTAIGNNVFYKKGLTSVTFGKNIKTIGKSAFGSNRALTEVDLSVCTGLTNIDDSAFESNTSVTALTLPNSLQIIGNSAFYANVLLTEVDLSVCTGLTTIGDYAFKYNYDLTTLSLPDSLQTIGNYAFERCDELTALETGSNLTLIDNYAFYNCDGLKTVNIKGGNNVTIGDGAFYYCEGLESVTIGDGVNIIGKNSFYGCDSLTDLSLGSSVETIGEGAFRYCSALKEITIPDSVKTINSTAFADSKLLKNVTIGSGCTTIKANAFNGYTTSLENITVSADNTTYTSVDGILFNKDKTTILLYPKSRSGKYTIPNNVTTIGELSFSYCKNLTEIVIGNSVITIGDSAFSSCKNITEVVIGDSVTTIGDSAFSNCVNLPKIVIGNSVTTIGDRAFSSCKNITEVVIGDSVTTIGDSAFSDCVNLPEIVTGNSVTTIGYRAFSSCKNITEVVIGDSVTTIGDSAFSDCVNLPEIVTGNSVTTIGDSAFKNCTNLIKAIIGNGVTQISNSTFENCKKLLQVKFGEKITAIDANAFSNCIMLKRVNMLECNALTTIDKDSFANCDRYIIYCSENSTTHKTLESNGYTNLSFDISEERIYTEGEFTYFIINENEVELVSYNGTSTDIVIPDVTTGSEFPVLANKKVTTIGNNVFADKNLTSIKFGKNLTCIGKSAFKRGFADCGSVEVDLSLCTGLTTIDDYAFAENFCTINLTLPDSIEIIGDFAFLSCYIPYLEIGSNLISIGDSAFAWNTSLSTVNIKGGNNATIGDYAFSDCYIDSLTIGDGVKTIGYAAFASCYSLRFLSLGNSVEAIGDCAFACDWALEEVIIPDSVKSIGYNAFMDNHSLKKVIIGSGCTFIGEGAFGMARPSLESFVVSEDNKVYSSMDGVLFNKDKTELIQYPYMKTGEYTIPDTVITIKTYAFSWCQNPSKITFGKNVKTIGDGAFDSHEVLDMTACNGLTTLGEYALSGTVYCNKDSTTHYTLEKYGYTNLVLYTNENQTYTEGDLIYSIINENEVKVVGRNGTRKDIVIPDVTTGSEFPILANKKVTAIGDSAFEDEDLTSIKFGKNLTCIGKSAFKRGFADYGSVEVDLSLCTGLTTIDDHAFEDGYIICNIKLPESLEIIGDYAFRMCYGEYLEIGSNIISIGEGAFYRGGFNTVNIKGGNNAIIGNSAFSECYIGSLIIGDGVKTIGYAAFASNGWSINFLSLGNSIETIEDYAFIGSVNLEEVTIPDSVKSIGKYTFMDNHSLKKVIIGSGCAFIGEGAFNIARPSLESFVVSEDNKVYSSMDGVLFNKDKTELIQYPYMKTGEYTIPDTVVTIKDYAFSWCQNPSKVTFGKNVKTIGDGAFDSHEVLDMTACNGLTTLGENALGWNNRCTIYCYKDSTTHYTLEKYGYTNLKFYTSQVNLTDITVNGTSVDSFSTETKDYTVYVDDATNVKIVPVFEEDNVIYTVTAENNVHTINVLNENDEVSDTYKITVKEYGYTVAGDISLMLDAVSATKVGGSIALPPGTYKLKIAKGSRQFGYNKTVTDYCNGLSLSEKYTSYITLNATGGTYTFQFDKKTNKLVIKRNSNMPNEYLIGDLNTILKPLNGKTLSIGTQNLEAGTYSFKLSIGGTEYGYNTTVNDVTTGSLSLSNKYSSQIVLNTTGGMYTFVLNTSTNRLEIRHTPTTNESKDDVHISGDISLILSDKDDNGADLTTATGTVELQEGTYNFKVYNYGTVYTSGTVINDKATKNLSNKYTTPVTLNATGGTYKFVFDKVTGALVVSLVEK